MAAKRIVLTTIGTRGDVQPYMALGLGLKRAGYDVRLAAPENFKDWIEGAGLEFARCGNDSRAFVTSPEAVDFLDGSLWYQIRNARKIGLDFIKSITEDIYHATRDADGIIFHPKADFSVDVAEAKNIPAIMAAFQPFTPTREFPIMVLPIKTLGPLANRMSYGVIYLSRVFYNNYLNQYRCDLLGLKPRSLFRHPLKIGSDPVPIFYAISEFVVPRPRDYPPHVHITGYWFLDTHSGWEPPGALQAFLETGGPTIYVGFGSMPLKDPAASGGMIVEALRKSNLRAVMARGWAGLRAEDRSDGAGAIHLIEDAPHEELFPLMDGVVHHGGAGTVAAGLRAGKPSFICPFLVDQPFWGMRVNNLGIGPPPIRPKNWTVSGLERSFRALVSNAGYKRRAVEMAAKLKSEDGVGRAVDLVKEIVGRPR